MKEFRWPAAPAGLCGSVDRGLQCQHSGRGDAAENRLLWGDRGEGEKRCLC